MLKHYLIISYRNLVKYKLYSLINILGLSIGLSCCILIALFVRYEISYDRWLPNSESIYRFETRIDAPNLNFSTTKSNFIAGRYLKGFYPEIKQASRVIDYDMVLAVDEQDFHETVHFVDSGFFEIFDLPLLQGNKDTALNDKYSIILSERMANKYFGREDIIGRVISADGMRDYKVAGVFKNIPDNSHLAIDFIIPYDENDADFGFGFSQDWLAIEGYTYLLFEPGFTRAKFNEKFPEFVSRYVRISDFNENESIAQYFPPPLLNVQDIYLHSQREYDLKANGNIILVYTFSIIAVLILLLASINFLNLSATRSLQRMRETAVRKVLGVNRKQLFAQYLGESTLLAFLALMLSLGVVELVMPWYVEFLSADVFIQDVGIIEALFILAGLVVMVGMVGGLYPAITMSMLHPSAVLRSNKSNLSGGSKWLRSSLVVFQFSVSAILIIATVVVYVQKTYMSEKDLGFNQNNKLLLRELNHEYAASNKDIIIEEIKQLPEVINAAYSAAAPSDRIGFRREIEMPAYPALGTVGLSPKSIDHEFLNVYDIPLLYGRNFSKGSAKDIFYWPDGNDAAMKTKLSSALLNEEAVKRIGFSNPQDAIGKIFIMEGVEFEIIGVVRNFHTYSLREKINSNMYVVAPEDHATLTVHYQAGVDVQHLIKKIRGVLKDLVPGFPVRYDFLDQNIKAQYKTDQTVARLMTIFSTIAILIACFGLYALTAYSTQRRTKEIGIRKVHGASIMAIARLLVGQFSKPVLLANIIAWPAAFFLVSEYLAVFEYRINISIWYFVLASLGTFGVALATVLYHTIKTAATRPVEALRCE